MARKKEKKEVKEHIPSKYQQAIYDFVEHGVGNLVVEACAGAGKTTTLIQILKRLPSDKKVLFCAFNKDIVKEIKKKVGNDYDNVDIRTVHSLGYAMVMNNVKIHPIPNDNKYRQYIINNFDELTTTDFTYLGYKKKQKFIDNVCRLTDLARFNLCSTYKEIKKVSDRYEIDLFCDEIETTIKVLNWGWSYLNEVDFTDMIWLPNILYLQPYGLQYDYILLDECQDISTAQRELVLKCKKINTRMFSLGDKNQCIYSFVSSDPESFDKLKQLPNTISLPLSISYRCPKNIVDVARLLVPTIEHNPQNINDGCVIKNSKLEDIQDGDMVLCRNNAPLMKIYNEFIRLGKKCYIKGKDIGLNLQKIVKAANRKELNVHLDKDGLFVTLYQSLFETRDHLIAFTGLDKKTVMESAIIKGKLDTIRALEVLSEDINTSEELIDKISKMFADKSKDGISLSTIHKAKGLEAENVHIACMSLLTNLKGKKDWELEQEHNLLYVAMTRAKNKLSFLDETMFNDFMDVNSESLKKIEEKVNAILEIKKSKIKKNVKTYENIIKKEKQIIKTNDNHIELVTNKENANKTNNGLMMKKRTVNITDL